MLEIKINKIEFYDENTELFIETPATIITLEHSLVSLSKWESKWLKPFLSKDSMPRQEAIDYIRCMTLNEDRVDPLLYNCIPSSELDRVNEYIEHKMTATWFNDKNEKPSREIVTAELIYYWMVSLQIPFQPCETWHLTRLLTLIKVCNLKNTPSKKMGRKEQLSNNRRLNAARRQALGTNG